MHFDHPGGTTSSTCWELLKEWGEFGENDIQTDMKKEIIVTEKKKESENHLLFITYYTFHTTRPTAENVSMHGSSVGKWDCAAECREHLLRTPNTGRSRSYITHEDIKIRSKWKKTQTSYQQFMEISVLPVVQLKNNANKLILETEPPIDWEK